MGIYKEIWAKDIAENLFPDSSFMTQAIDDSMYVEGAVVHLPQAGASVGVEVNRTTFPASASGRTDTVLDYNIDSFTSNPTIVRNIEKIELSYDKRQSVIFDHKESIQSRIAAQLLYKWGATASTQIVRTTGANRAATAPSATGTRKKITIADILEVKRIFDAQDIPQEGRIVVLPATMYNDLLEIEAIYSAEKFGMANLPKGAVSMILGFAIFVRSSANIYNNAGTPVIKTPGAAAAATDNLGALFFHNRFVRRALGESKPFFRENDPLYYGDVMNFEVLAGGSKKYSDERGVVSLVEAAGV